MIQLYIVLFSIVIMHSENLAINALIRKLINFQILPLAIFGGLKSGLLILMMAKEFL